MSIYSYSQSTLFPLTLSSELPESIRQELQAQNWDDYRDYIDRRLRMYNDDWEEILVDYIKDQISSVKKKNQYFPPNATPKWPILTHINVLKRVVEEISLVYKNEPIRKMRKEVAAEEGALTETELVETETTEPAVKAFEESERYAEIVGGEYPLLMAKVNELVNVCNLILVGVMPDENQDIGIRFDLLTPDMFVPIQDPNNPSRLIGIIYFVATTDTSSNLVTNIVEYLVYMGQPDEEGFIVKIDNRSDERVEKKPYPFIYEGEKFFPFAVFRNDYPEKGSFVNRTQGDDLYNGTLHIGDLSSEWMHRFKSATGTQLSALGNIGDKLIQEFVRDSLYVNVFPISKEDGEIVEHTFKMDANADWDAILKNIEIIITTYGLSIDKFKGTPQSGLSIKIQNEGLINIIEGQYPYYRFGEMELANIIRKVNNAMVKGVDAIPDDYDFFIKFGRLPFEPTPEENWETDVAMSDRGITSDADIYMKHNPDVDDRDVAQAQIMKNKQMNRELRAGQAGTPDTLPIPVETETEEEAGAPPPNELLEGTEGVEI
jgi:hypothetical protein